jgi:CBS domain-containing protein
MPLRARDLMKADPITVAADTPFLELQHLFVEAQIGGAPVVDDRGRVRGVVSRVDLLRAIDQVCDEDLDVDEDGADEAELVERLDTLKALDVTTPDPIWVSPDAPIAEVAQTMRRLGVHRVLVGDAGRIDGILTAFDLLAAVD